MRAAFKVNVDAVRRIAAKADDPALRSALHDVVKEKGTVAIIGQAINDNFQKSGPGWEPLKIRTGKPLMKSGLLRQSVTTPGAQGNIYSTDGSTITWGTNLIYASIHNRGGVITVKNAKYLFIPTSAKGMRVGPQRDPSQRKGKNKLVVGRDVVFKKSVRIPARPFLVIQDFWREQLWGYVYGRMESIVQNWMGQ